MLISGGSGSLGQALTRRLLDTSDAQICIYSRDEAKHAQMATWADRERVRYFIGDVRDQRRLELALRDVDTAVHAAALKRVEAGEYDPAEFIATNINGTGNVLYAAMHQGVGKVLVVSTDKASAPTTLYGITKAAAEALAREFGAYCPNGPTRFAAVRYGNVAGSRGSLIPTWRALIAAGAVKLPVTDAGMTRFWMTMDEAVDFVLWSLDTMEGGELFVPQLPAFRVTDLASAMGHDWYVSGVRGVEKVAETLVSANEASCFRAWQGRYVRFPEGLEDGEPLPRGFELSSDRAHMLSVAELRERLENIV